MSDYLDRLSELVAAALLAREGSFQKADEINFRCVVHDEQNPSAGFNVERKAWKCQACSAKGGVKKLAEILGIEVSKAHAKATHRKGEDLGPIVATYDYRNGDGHLLYQAVRYHPHGRDKTFRVRRMNGSGDWSWNLDGVELVLYRLPEILVAIRQGLPIFVVEGEKDCDNLANLELTATCNLGGAGKWRSQYSEVLRGADVVVIPDNDDPGRQHADAVCQSLLGIAASVQRIELAGLPPKGDVSDWLAAGHTKEELLSIVEATEPLTTKSLVEVVATFRRWLHLPDVGVLYALGGAIVANRLAGDPVWLLIIAPPGSGKTEILASVSSLPNMHLVGTITEAALLSGTSKRDTAKDAKGGLLREIGEFGFIVLKDFTSILSMHRDTRSGVLAALREIFDGSWTRRVGADGGKELSWSGKVGLIGGCTPAIDNHHAVIATMGERFIFLRLPIDDGAEQGRKALDHVGNSKQMRAQLADAVRSFFAGVLIPETVPSLDDNAKERLVALSTLAVRCRSAVERDPYRREIEAIPDPEAPARLVITLARLFIGMAILNVPQAEAWRVVTRCALDSMPRARRAVFDLLRKEDGQLDTTTIAQGIKHPTVTTHRACEELTAHGVVDRLPQGKGKADLWQLSDWARERYRTATSSEKSGAEGSVDTTSSEMSDSGDCSSSSSSLFNTFHSVQDDFSEEPPSGEEEAVFYDDAREYDP